MDATLCPPPRQSALGVVDDVVVEPLGDKPVVCERMEFRGPMVAGSPREEPVDVDHRFSGAPTFAKNRRQRSACVRHVKPFRCLEKIEQLAERDLAASIRCEHGRDFTLVEPAV